MDRRSLVVAAAGAAALHPGSAIHWACDYLAEGFVGHGAATETPRIVLALMGGSHYS